MSTQTLPPFKVGQIIFLIPNGERRVMPAQVTEEILRRTLAGTETVWMIQLAGSAKSVPLDPEAAEYYIDVAELRQTLVSRTTQQVNTMIDRVVEAAWESFPTTDDRQQQLSVDAHVSEQVATVILPDGKKAKVRMP